MRNVLEKLRVLQEEEEGRLQGLLKSNGACEQQRRQLEAELAEFRKDLQKLAEEDLEPETKASTEDELVARWRLYSVTRAALAAEEPRVDRLQAQLKKLIAFPQDPQPLSDSVVATIQEFQRLKAKTSRLCNAADVQLWQRLQRPLQDLQLWRALAQRLLDVTASLPDPPSIHTFLPQIEAALAESSRLKEQLTILQLKKDLLGGVFGQERAAVLLEQVATSVRDRDLLHNRLLQRKSKLQSSLAQHKDFGAAFEPLQKKLLDLRIRIQAENGLQRDLPGKQAQLSRLQGLQEEGLDLGAQVEATRSLIQDNPNHQHKMDQLSADYQALHRSLEDLVDRCQQSVREHCTFSHQLLELRHWLAVLTQKLEAHRGYLGPWDAQSREAEAEVRWLFSPPGGRFPPCTPKSRSGGWCSPTGDQRPPSLTPYCVCVSVCPSETAGRAPREGGPAAPDRSPRAAGDGEVLSGGGRHGPGGAGRAGGVVGGPEAAGGKPAEPRQKPAAAEDGSGFREENDFHQQHSKDWVSHHPHRSHFPTSPSGTSAAPGGRRQPRRFLPAPEEL
uniref:Nesprin-1/3 spectrin repeats region domain-containing protein n=1 Tax=Sus scrofa TaxID=9823 RepID=A0A8D1FUH4_PIG